MEFDPDFPCAVDIPVPHFGNQNRILLLLDAASSCSAGATVTTFGEPEAAEVRQWFNRISTKSPEDADRLAKTFRTLGAKRVR